MTSAERADALNLTGDARLIYVIESITARLDHYFTAGVAR